MKRYLAILIAVFLLAGCHFKGRSIMLKETCFGIASEIEYDRIKLIEPRKYWFELQEMIAFRHAFVLLSGTPANILKAEQGKALIEVKIEGKPTELWIDSKYIQ